MHEVRRMSSGSRCVNGTSPTVLRVACVALAVAFAWAAPASAGVAGVNGGKLVYTGSSAADEILVGYLTGGSGDGWLLTAYGTTAITAQAGCSGGPTVVTCAANAVTGGLQIDLGDGVNVLDTDLDHPVPSGTRLSVTGGSGEDYVLQSGAREAIEDQTIVTFGGGDYVEIGAGADDVDTGDGADRVFDYGGSAADAVRLGAQDDTVFAQSSSADGSDAYDGGRGRDRVVYQARTVPVTADLSGKAPGLTPEDALTGLEEVTGSPTAANTLIGNGARNYLVGGAAGDVLEGGTNDDVLEGRHGDNRLVGGQGWDVLTSGSGDDELDTRDGMGDSLVRCEGGADEALVDQFDGAGSDCESVSTTSTAVPSVFIGLTLDSPGGDVFSTAPFPTETTPYVVSLQTPDAGGGEISIGTASVTRTPPTNATFQGPQYEIATQGTGAPLRITFSIDYSARLPGPPAVFRDGLELPACTGATGLPAGVAACVTAVAQHQFSNTGGWTPMEIAVLADHAGSWNVGWYPTPDDGGGGNGDGSGGGGGLLLPVPPTPVPPGNRSGGTADTTGPVIPGASAAPAATVRSNRFAFTIGPFSEPVTGTVALVSNAIRYRGKQARIKLPAKPFAAAPGKRFTLAFRLTRKQSRLLAKARKVKLTATVTARDVHGNASSRKVGFQLKAARKSN
jgi:hypothetical protein